MTTLPVLLLLATAMVKLPGGTWRPLYGRPTDAPIAIAPFRLDRDAVTRGDFLTFARANPQWRRDDLARGTAVDRRRPMTDVSWFAARAYCEWRGARLPSLAEWEYAAAASATNRDAAREPAFMQELLALYSTRPRPLPPVEKGIVNAYGVRGLHGLAWEWVADFGTAPGQHEHASHDHGGRAKAAKHDMSCAGAAIGATDPSNYAAFLRYAFRSGLSGQTSLETLGFRCAA